MNEEEAMKLKEEKMIQAAFDHLLKTYAQSNHRQKFDIITKAFHIAHQAHKGVRRLNGEPYIMHPLAVAQIVSEEIGLGSTSICAALLHDVVEDTDYYSIEDIRKTFGDKIAQIVDGLTKIPDTNHVLQLQETVSMQAENMRKLLLTMSEDIRVILIKIADRLHNMRTLGAMRLAKQFKIAGETMFLYAPMANRLGLFSIKTELEDLSFKYEHPEEYKQIAQKLEATTSNRVKIYENFATPLYPKLEELGIQYKIQARVKSIYSIWNKMQSKKENFEDIYDIFAVRIVFVPKPDVDVKRQCWDIFFVINDLYRLRSERIRDWVTHPKANGYQALHLTVMGPDGQWVEVQIRSDKMEEIDERGVAAHWKYKEFGDGVVEEVQTELDKWLEKIKDVLEAPNPDAMDFLDTIKLNLFVSDIFVFTPKGEFITLPQEATALDFAYEIHSNVGDKSIGAKVNHKLVPLSYKLTSGDQVEILTSRSQQPHADWLNFITTSKAKTKIESALKKQKKEKIKIGEQLLAEFFSKMELELSIPILDKILAYYGYPKKENLYFAIAEKQIDLPDNLKKVLTGKSNSSGLVDKVKQVFGSGSKDNNDKILYVPQLDARKIDRKKTYILEEENFQKNYIAAACCNPIPGEEVLGFISEDGGLEVHKRSCPQALILKTRFGDRIISCDWAGHKALSFPGKIEIRGIDRMGMLNDITQAITNEFSVNMRKLVIDTNDGLFEGTIEVSIHDMDDINKLSTRIRKIKGVKSVKRVN
jgi:GTP pyrophosphokinase